MSPPNTNQNKPPNTAIKMPNATPPANPAIAPVRIDPIVFDRAGAESGEI
jgi:hypothetical protein